jgi:hypothetical protein
LNLIWEWPVCFVEISSCSEAQIPGTSLKIRRQVVLLVLEPFEETENVLFTVANSGSQMTPRLNVFTLLTLTILLKYQLFLKNYVAKMIATSSAD